MSNRRLSGKQKAFINAYFGKANYNATKAAELAGYKGNGVTLGAVGNENLNKPLIAEEIKRRFRENAMSADEVIRRLGEQGRAEYSKYLLPDGSVDLKSLLADDKGHLIKGIIPTKAGNRIEFYDSQSALNTLAKHHGLLADRLEVKIADELGSALDLLKQNLDEDTYHNVLKVLAGDS